MSVHLSWPFAAVVSLFAGLAVSAEPLREFRFNAAEGPFGGQEATVNLDKRFAYRAADDFLEISNLADSRYCTLSLKLDCGYSDDLQLSFEYRNVVPDGVNIAYTAINLFNDRNHSVFASVPASAEWQTAVFDLGKLKTSQTQSRFPDGSPLRKLNIYSRIANADPEAKVKLEIRNVKLAVNPEYNPLAGVRVSYSAYPLIDWPGGTEARGNYKIELSADPAFAPAATRVFFTDVPFWASPDPIAPGLLLHYRITDADTGKILKHDQLLTADRVNTWRRPEFDFAAFAEKPRPRLRKLAEFYHPDPEKLEKEAEKLLDFSLPANPEPYREGADPETRSWVEWYGKAGKIISGAGRNLTTLAQAAMLTGRTDLKKKAAELALAVSRTWDPEGGSNAARHDLACCNLLMGLGWTFDAAYDILTPEERRLLADAIRIRGRQFRDMTFPFRGNEAQNHPWDRAQAAAFAAVSLAEEPESALIFAYVADLYAYRFLPSLGFDGENNEGLAYWSYGLGLAVRFTELAKYAVGLDYYTQPWLRQTARFPFYCAPAGGYAVSFADNGRPNHNQKGPINRPFTAKLAAAAGDAAALWYAGLPETSGTEARFPAEMEPSKYYPHIGLAVFNTFLPDGRENTAVGFHSGKYFAGHQHADQNSFVINAYGDKLAIDGGYYDWWGSRHFRAYSIHTQAHNTILVNGKGQNVHTAGADGESTGYFDSPNFGYVAGDASNPRIYNGELKRFNRQLVFVKPDYVFTFDRLAAPEPATFSYLLHSHSDEAIAWDSETRSFSFERPLAGLTGRVLLPEKARGKVKTSYEVMPVLGYSETVDPEPQPEWTLSVDNADPATEAEFLAAMRIDRRGVEKPAPEWQKIEAGNLVGVRTPDCIVLFNRQPGQAARLEANNLPAIETDAAAAAIRFNPDGEVFDVMFAGGGRLQYGDRTWTGKDSAGFALRTGRQAVREQAADALKLDGQPVAAELYAETLADGSRIYSLHGAIEIDRERDVVLNSSGHSPLPLHLMIGQAERQQLLRLEPGETASAAIRLNPGKMIFSITSGAPLGKLEFKPAE